MKMKNNLIVLDSNVLIAFFNASDSLHERSRAVMKETIAFTKVVNDLIFAEVGTVLLTRTKQTAFISENLQQILSGKIENLRVTMCTPKLLTETVNIFSQQENPWLSVEDCSIIAQARKLKAQKIVTFDRGLRKMFAKEFEFLPKKL